MNSTTHKQRQGRLIKHSAGKGLVVLNLALLFAFGTLTFSQRAHAQNRADSTTANRVPGDYSVVGGSPLGGVTSTIYVLDSANREMIALKWNDSTKQLEGIGYRDLDMDTKSDPDR